MWPFRRLDKGFTHLQWAARHTAQKIEYTATRYAAAEEAYAAALNDPYSAPETMELSVLLDALIVYLRILPDLVADAAPYFYSNPRPKTRSFREHKAWFTKTRPDSDPEYAEILVKHTSWFEDLAGKNEKGIRNLLLHRFGRFQFPIIGGPASGRGRVTPDLVTKAGYLVDVRTDLRRIVEGLCDFLDRTVVHLNGRILSHAGWAPLTKTDGTGCKLMDYETVPSSSWLLPTVSGKGPG